MTKLFVGAVMAVLIAISAAAPARAAELVGTAAIRAVIGNTFHGEDDGGEFWDYYAPDGRFYSLQDGEINYGSWRIEGTMLCMIMDEKICSEVVVSGDEVVMYDDDGEDYEGELLPGDFKRLR